jgi:putative spermidine/putrescine transport system permease protein
MAIAVPSNEVTTPSLKQRLARAERLNRWKAQALIAPLVVFCCWCFWCPSLRCLYKSVGNPEVVAGLPRTVVAVPPGMVVACPANRCTRLLSEDLAEARKNQTLGDLSKRLNMELAGYRSLLTKTAGRCRSSEVPASYKEALENLDERWGDPAYWQAIRRNTSSVTPLLPAGGGRSPDRRPRRSRPGHAGPGDLPGYLRPHLLDGPGDYLHLPAAGVSAGVPAGQPAGAQSNLLMILVLLPFWTSVLVRVAAWIVLLQSGGLINGALMGLGIIDKPLELVFNRTGVYIAMVHILLPFMILPIYSVMKGISPTYMRAAISLGCHPFASFWRVYFPQTYAGVGAGCLLVFIIAIGYYITPALLGSPNDQMVSYFVAFYTNTSINWGMATALGGLLLLATVVLYLIYNWLVGASRLRLS